MLPSVLKEYTSIIKKPQRGNEGEKITWTNDQIEHEPVDNVLPIGGLIGEARTANTEILAWDLFITSDIIVRIVTHTNSKIMKKIAEIASP